MWLCRPGLAKNPCESDLTTTVVRPDGTTRVVHDKPAKSPPVDCFYVYPSVSGQPTVNADLSIDPELTAVAEAQASRFSQACRVFAPVYRQLTVVAIGSAGGQSADNTPSYATARVSADCPLAEPIATTVSCR